MPTDDQIEAGKPAPDTMSVSNSRPSDMCTTMRVAPGGAMPATKYWSSTVTDGERTGTTQLKPWWEGSTGPRQVCCDVTRVVFVHHSEPSNQVRISALFTIRTVRTSVVACGARGSGVR